MISPPRTRAEAEKRTYGSLKLLTFWPFIDSLCAWEIESGLQGRCQCPRKPGHGPDALYCRIHAKMVEKGS